MKKTTFLLLTLCLLVLACYASPIKVDYDNGVYHIILSGNKIKKNIQFVSSPNLITNREAHMRGNSLLTINTGFFDPKNQKTISYIANDYQNIEEPIFNENLLQNPVLRKNLKTILNRTEFRILDCDGKLRYEIASHDTKVDFLCSVKTSAQGGPRLLPDLRLEEEFFIVKDKDGNVIRESASMLHKVPRTLIGFKSTPNDEQELHIFIVTNKNPMTIYEARDLCAKYELDSAMAFDGGSSTSLDYKDIHVVSTEANDTGRSLKSFMIIKK
ncbi:MAG: phosphodiester glycosidase family protein [bacterium]|nr:phosphodiester glycosidase family protein [bacterium]